MISVVVPVYNVEKYLEKCLNSLLAQTYVDFEIVLVNDGSTDNSGIICEKFAEEYDCINYIKKKNGGLSDARNCGVANAQGDLVTFVDSDDYIDKNYLYLLKKNLDDNFAEMAVCEFQIINESDMLGDVGECVAKVHSGFEALELMLRSKMHGSSACGILMLKRIAEEFPFPIGKYNEDDYTTFKYYASVKTVVSISSKLYVYVQRSGSIMHKEFGQPAIDCLDAADYLVQECKLIGKIYEDASYCKFVSNYIYVFSSYPNLKEIDNDIYIRVLKGLKNASYKILYSTKSSVCQRISSLLYIIFGHRVLRIYYRNNT